MNQKSVMKNILFIDTSKREQISVGLQMNGKKFTKVANAVAYSSQVLLPLVVAILDEHALSLPDIDSIQVNPGPGSFTGLRVGITVANTLSYVLQIPVNGKKFNGELLVVPSYS